MNNKRILILARQNDEWMEKFIHALMRGFEVIVPSTKIISESLDDFLVKEVGIVFSVVDARLQPNTSDSELSEIFALINKLLVSNIPVLVLSKSEDSRNLPFVKEIPKDRSQNISFIMVDEEDYKKSFLAENFLPIKEWVSKLAGDSSTDAPPPKDKRKKRKGN